MSNERIVVVHRETESTIVKLAKITALVIASPFIMIISLIALTAIVAIVMMLIGSGATVFQTAAPWLVGTLIVCAVLPAVRDRISNKKKIVVLQQKVHALELELSETRLESMKAHETAEFHRLLNESKGKAGDSVKI